MSTIVLVGLACAANLAYTWHSPLLTSDSASYLSAAQNLVSGKGITTSFNVDTSSLHPSQALSFHGRVPLSGYEPLYPIVVAAFHYLGLSQIGAARMVGVLSIALVVLLLCLLSYWAFSASVPLMVVFVALAVVGPDELEYVHFNMLQLSGSVLSDSLFDVFMLASFLMTAIWLVREQRRFIVLASAFITLAILTRYAAAGIALAVGLAILTTRTMIIRTRVYGIVCVWIATAIGLVGWPVVDGLLFHGSAPRQFAYHVDPHLVSKTLTAVGDWFFPSNWVTGFTYPASIFLLAVAATLPLSDRFFGLVRKGSHQPSPRAQALLRVCALFIPSYLLVVVITDTFLDATLAVDQRILGPLQVVLYLILISIIYWTVRSRLTERSHLVSAAVTFGVALLVLFPNLSTISKQIRTPFPTPKVAPETSAVAALPASDVVVTNETAGTYIFAHRGSIYAPVNVFVTTERPNPEFRRDVVLVGRLLRRRGGVVMLIPVFIPGPAAASEFEQWAGLRVTRRFPDGTVFLAVPSRIGTPSP